MRGKVWTWLIVAGAIALVLMPVLSDLFTDEIARWHLAAATNALQTGREDYAEQVERATNTTEDIGQLRDYWLYRTYLALEKDPESIPDLVREARSKNSKFASIGVYAAFKLEARSQFDVAVEALEAAFSDRDRKRPQNLNFLAYLRALAGIELDQALEDINQALEHYPEDAAFRDTRAWVLFQMGNPLDALEDAQFAVAGTESMVSESPIMKMLSGLEDALSGRSNSEDPPDTPLPESKIDLMVWNVGVMRYHRARILEALGRSDEAEQDFEWLRKHRLPQDDSLN